MPRRLTGAEERELLAVAKMLRAAEEKADEVRSERDRLILELVDDGARIVDVADVLAVTRKTVHDAMARARER